ncbi:MAG: ATP-binding protein [Bacteroidales bacterium]|nr:ATP-binding protein [Bacteroidales bacterium]
MKEIVVISGKGGTGKTSLTAAFACLEGADMVVADCDVDAADMHLLLSPDFAEEEVFISGELAEIDPDRCTNCGKCMSVCRFDAVFNEDNSYRIDPLSCEGCGYCARVCPVSAIINRKRESGKWYVSSIKTGSMMVHARLFPGAGNSGKLVAVVKSKAKEIANAGNKEFVIVDGSPGVGCPVVSSLSGAHFVVLVTEPSVSGLHDLKRVYELVRKFGIPAGCIINKSDINSEISSEIHGFLKAGNIAHHGDLPFDDIFVKSLSLGQTVTEYNDRRLLPLIEGIWASVKTETLKNNNK